MVQPINYLAAMPQPGELLRSIQGGLQVGSQIQQMQMQRQAFDMQRQQAKQAQAAQVQYQAELQAALANPTPRAFAALTARYPQHREAVKQAADQFGQDRIQAELRDAGTIAAALQANRPEVAVSRLDKRIAAMETAGEDSASLKLLREQVQTSPQQALGSLLRVVSGLPGGEKLLENLGKVGTEERAAALAPAAQRKAAAEATTAEVAAKYADSQAIQDLALKGWNIKAIEADIGFKRESNRIAAMNAALNREGNELKREELRMKIDDARRARESAVREKVATAEAGASSIDNMLNTVERIKANKSLGDVVGSFEGRLPAVVTSGLDDEEADAIALIETLGSQAFLAQIPNIKGMGALSNAEGEKLQSALQNLGRAQSEKQFRANLDEAARLLNKGRESLARSTGVPLGRPDTPAAPGARPPLDSFFR